VRASLVALLIQSVSDGSNAPVLKIGERSCRGAADVRGEPFWQGMRQCPK